MSIRPSKFLHQKAVLWAFSDYDDYGEARVSAAVEVNTRWEQVTSEIVGADGSPIAVDGTVFIDQDVTQGSMLWLGLLKNLPSPVVSGLMEVVAFNKMPGVKGRTLIRSVSIRKFKDSLPTVV